MSSPGVDDVCPICLCPIDEEFSRPENCQHRYDLDCLTEWAKLRLSCPSCRAEFGAIYSYKLVGGKPTLHKVQKMEQPREVEPFDETNPLDFTMCEICSGGMHEELLLICDQCDKGFHTYCLTPPLDAVPTSEQWFCPQCEESRMRQPSTSRSATASARAFRLVQRTALAERVRRALARNRRVMEDYESSTEGEDEEEEDDDDEEEEEDSVASTEEEMNDFLEDDARVLDEIYHDWPRTAAPLPVVKRRSKKERKASKKTTKTRKRKTPKKRRSKGKRRKTKGVRRRSSKRTVIEGGPMDVFVHRRGAPRDPVARLSLLGAGLEPVADDDPLVTENSRRFDQPIIRRKEEHLPPFKDEVVMENIPVADKCDLIGSIIPEQVKTLAPGRLFAVRGGRFNTTEDFEKYKERKTKQLSSELKELLGIPVEQTAVEDSSKNNKIKETPKVNNVVDKADFVRESSGCMCSSSFKKPELKEYSRYCENRKIEGERAYQKALDGRSQLSSQKLNELAKRRPAERTMTTTAFDCQHNGHTSKRTERDDKNINGHSHSFAKISHHSDGQPTSEKTNTAAINSRDHQSEHGCKTSGGRYRALGQMSNRFDRQRSNDSMKTKVEIQDRQGRVKQNEEKVEGESRLLVQKSSQPDRRSRSDRLKTPVSNNRDHQHDCDRDSHDDRSLVERILSFDQISDEPDKNKGNMKAAVGNGRQSNGEKLVCKDRKIEKRHPPFCKRSNETGKWNSRTGTTTDMVTHRHHPNDRAHRHDDEKKDLGSGSGTRNIEHNRKRQLIDTEYNTNLHLHNNNNPSTKMIDEEASTVQKSEREDLAVSAKPLLDGRINKVATPLGSSTECCLPSLQASAAAATVASCSKHDSVKSVNKEKQLTSDELLSTIDGFAKEGIKHYKKRLTSEEYKDVMRAVVRECYKKRILDEVKIKEKVKKYVHALKNGELLPTGHHGSKRNEELSGNEANVPMKKRKVDVQDGLQLSVNASI